MASIRLAPTIAEISGSLGPTVFRRTRAGHVAGSRPSRTASMGTPPNLQTLAVQRLARTWATTVTAPTKLLWARYADALQALLAGRRFRHPPGSAWGAFLLFNVPRVIYGLSPITTPPGIPAIDAPPRCLLSFPFINQIYMTLPGDLPGAGEWFLWELSRPYTKSSTRISTTAMRRKLLTGPLVAGQIWTLSAPFFPRTRVTVTVRRLTTTRIVSAYQTGLLTWPA